MGQPKCADGKTTVTVWGRATSQVGVTLASSARTDDSPLQLTHERAVKAHQKALKRGLLSHRGPTWLIASTRVVHLIPACCAGQYLGGHT